MLLVCSIIVLYLAYRNSFKGEGINVVLMFRGLTLGLLVLLLFDVTLEKNGTIKKNLPWHIYVDRSLSIKYHKQPSSSSYKKGIQNLLNELSEKNLSLEVYSFGSSLDTLKNILELQLDANSTNFGLIFDNIRNDYDKNLAGAIILTDGQINQGPVLEELSYEAGVPIHIVGIGNTTPMRDVFVQSVDIPPLCVKGDKVNIDVLISSLGEVKERVNITLFNDNNKLIGSKIIKMSGNGALENIRFQIAPDVIGKNNFLVKCSALSDEINIQNNQQKLTIHVMKDQYNIALVTGAPNFNTKVIKSYLSKNGNNFVDHFIINDKNFNSSIKGFLEKKYEVIIFDNNPVSSNSEKWNSILRIFAKKLISHSSSFFIVPGAETDFKSLSNYLKIVNIDANPLLSNKNRDIEWKFLQSWSNFSSYEEEAYFLDNSISYPPQNPAFQILNEFDGKLSNVYANYLNSDKQNPLLIIGEKKFVRYALWNSTDIASIKYMLSGSDLNFIFESSIKKIINWLMKKSNNGEFIFRTDKNSYQQGEEVTLTGVSSELNEDLMINDGFVELYHESNYMGSKSLFYDLNENKYKSRFWAPKPGNINYRVRINRGLESYEVSNGNFKVQESHIELNRIFLNHTKLLNLAEFSGGSFKNWSNISELDNIISQVQESEFYVLSFLLRNNYLFICIIIIILSLEWFYRRKIGLI